MLKNFNFISLAEFLQHEIPRKFVELNLMIPTMKNQNLH